MIPREDYKEYCQAAIERGVPPLDYISWLENRAVLAEEHAINIMDIGLNTGVFLFANLLIDGAQFDRRILQAISDLLAKKVEESTDMPAEDFALKVQPAIDQIINDAKERS